MKDTFFKDWIEVRDSILEGKLSAAKSYMWEKWIVDFPIDKSPLEFLGNLFKDYNYRSYNFIRQEKLHFLANLEKAFQNFFYLLSITMKKLGDRLWLYTSPLPHFRAYKSYPNIIRTLKLLGLWEDYQKFCIELNIAKHSFNTAKLFYVSTVLEEIIQHYARPIRILEIGAGTGSLSVILSKRFNVSQYVIVDLPEMILYSSMTTDHLLNNGYVS